MPEGLKCKDVENQTAFGNRDIHRSPSGKNVRIMVSVWMKKYFTSPSVMQSRVVDAKQLYTMAQGPL